MLTESALTGSYEAMSSTAMGITGDLTLEADRLTLTLDQRYETELVGHVPATQEYANEAGSFGDLLILSGDGPVELRRVAAEAVGPGAPNGGLCHPNRTTFVALVSSVGPSGDQTLSLAAFNGTAPPGPAGDETDLCGTFTYAAVPSSAR